MILPPDVIKSEQAILSIKLIITILFHVHVQHTV